MAAAKGQGSGKPPRVDTDELLKRWEADKKSRVFLQLADEYRKQDQIDAALGVLREGLKVHPTFQPAHVGLARCLLAKGQLAEAQAELEPIVRKSPDNLLAGKLLAEVLEERGEGQRALAILGAILPFAIDDPEVSQRVAELEARLTPPGTGESEASDTAEFRAHDTTRPTQVAEASPIARAAEAAFDDAPLVESDEPFPAVLSDDVDGDGAPDLGDALPMPVPSEPVPAELLGSARGEDTPAVESAEDEFASVTLAELYESQGGASEAAAIYARLLARRPDDVALRRSLERCRARMDGRDVVTSIIESVAAPAPTLARPRWEPVRPRAGAPAPSPPAGVRAPDPPPDPEAAHASPGERPPAPRNAGGHAIRPPASRRTLRELQRWLQAVAAVRQ